MPLPSVEEMRRDVDADNLRRRMSEPMSPVFAAQVNGFNCANCDRAKINFVPIRRNENGPFFCCFFCAFDFAGKNGDVNCAEKAAKMKSIFSGKEGI